MRIRTIGIASALIPLSLAIAACSGAPAAQNGAIDTQPTTLEQAATSLAQLDDALRANPNDTAAKQDLATIRAQLDGLNNLVARVEPVTGHVVSFYEPRPGQIGISETGPDGSDSLITGEAFATQSSAQIYRALTNGAEAPAALAAAEDHELAAINADARAATASVGGAGLSGTTEVDPITTSNGERVAKTSEALSPSGQTFSNTWCMRTNADAYGCLPDWSGGGFAQGNTKTSFFRVEPITADVDVKATYNGSVFAIDVAPQGEVFGFWMHSDSFWTCCGICACGTQDYNIRTHRYDIIEASGVTFHWAYAFRWTCGDTLTCNGWPTP
jgi:hypothetical protein